MFGCMQEKDRVLREEERENKFERKREHRDVS